MANKTITMLQIRKVLQLLDQGFSQRRIALEVDISRNTVQDYCVKFLKTGHSWYLIHEYLSGYVFHAEVNWGIYILTSIAMLFIVLVSVGYQSAKAAMSNPVDSLRSE